jgi:hypothetical protein
VSRKGLSLAVGVFAIDEKKSSSCVKSRTDKIEIDEICYPGMGELASKTKPEVPSLNLNLNLGFDSKFRLRDSKKDHLNKSGYDI